MANASGRDRSTEGFEGNLRSLLDDVAVGSVSTKDALEAMRHLPLVDLGYARVDHHRELRTGFPEVVFGPGKSEQQLRGIVHELLRHGVGPILVTRATAGQIAVVEELAADAGLEAHIETEAGAIGIVRNVQPSATRIAVVTAGTADLHVAHEAVLVAS